jgi:hypothetical protein
MFVVMSLLCGPALAAEPAPAASQRAPATAALTADEVEQRIAAADGRFFVFDANHREMYDAGHVPTAKWVPFDGVTADLLPADKTATLVFYCANEH